MKNWLNIEIIQISIQLKFFIIWQASVNIWIIKISTDFNYMKLNFPLPKPALGFGAPSNLAGPNAPLIVAPWDDATKYNLIICYFILVL